MTNHKIQFVGTPCGQHGNYTFYKAFRYCLNGKQKILSLGEFFFFKIWREEDILSIGEVQLLWEDKPSGQVLVSLRLYFRPENTPEGRCEEHGEHEVVSLSEKVILRAEDVVNNLRPPTGVRWDTGLEGVYGPCSTEQLNPMQETQLYESPASAALDIREILREKNLIGDVVEPSSLHVIVLAYDKYCRIRALLKRVEGMEEEGMRSKIVKALGGFLVPSRNTKLLFCRDVFDYPELEGHELLCNHLAPKLQGRPRKKMLMRGDSESDSSDTSEDQRPMPHLASRLIKPRPGLNVKPNSLIRGMKTKDHSSYTPSQKSSLHSLPSQIKKEFSTPALDRLIEADFMSKLYKFMKDKNTPITRVPYLGYRPLNIFELFTRVQQLGGYELVTQKKLWALLFEEFNGKPNPQSLSQPNATPPGPNVLRRHYERLLLPYESYLIQEQKKLMGYTKRSKMQQSPQLKKQSKSHSQNQQQKSIYGGDQGASPQPKSESGEPSVSILQPVTCASAPIGASFKVADGGSTTITLIPVSGEGEPHLAPITTAKVNKGLSVTYTPAPTSTVSCNSTLASTTGSSNVNSMMGATAGAASGSASNSSNSNRSSPFNCFAAGGSPPFAGQSPPLVSMPELLVPRIHNKKEGALPADLAKRPEITITPIPRSVGSFGGSPFPLQLADLMALNVNLNSHLGVSALQDLAKIAERYDKVAAEQNFASKKFKNEDGMSLRVNGASQRNNSSEKNSCSSNIPDSPPTSKAGLPLPDLMSADFFRQVNALESCSSKLLLPAHQSTKTINALAALLPQTSIFPAPAPAAHQQFARSPLKAPIEVCRPEPILQTQSVYSQSKTRYDKPLSGVTKDSPKDNKKRSSPDIEILDLRIVSENKNTKPKNDRSEIELLDLSTRKDITVSAIPRAGTSKLTGKIHGQFLKSPDSKAAAAAAAAAANLSNFNCSPSPGLDNSKHNLPLPNLHSQSATAAAAFASALAAQSIPPGLGHLGAGLNPSLLHYMMSPGAKPPPGPPTSQSSVSVFPYLDPTSLASYYSLFPTGPPPVTTSPSPSSPPASSNSAAAAQQAVAAAAIAQLAQLNTLGLGGISSSMSPESMSNLGIYKNYLPQGSLPAPHFLSGLMSPGGPTPPTSK